MTRLQGSITFLAATMLAASASLATAATDDSNKAADAASGEARNCISLASIQSTKVLDDRTILFKMTGGETLVNNLPQRCPGLGFEKAFGYKTSLTQLCNTDIIWVVRQAAGGIERGASCGLGKFEPFVEPEGGDAVKDNGKLEPM